MGMLTELRVHLVAQSLTSDVANWRVGGGGWACGDCNDRQLQAGMLPTSHMEGLSAADGNDVLHSLCSNRMERLVGSMR